MLNKRSEEAKQELKDVGIQRLKTRFNLSDETVKEFVKHMKNNLIDQPDKGLPAIYINEPNDWFKFRAEHKKATKHSKISNSKQTDATEYYTRPITSVENAIAQTSDVIQKTFDRLKTPFRLNFAFNIIYEAPVGEGQFTDYVYKSADIDFNRVD